MDNRPKEKDQDEETEYAKLKDCGYTILETSTKEGEKEDRMTGTLWKTLLDGSKIWVLNERTRTARRDQD